MPAWLRGGYVASNTVSDSWLPGLHLSGFVLDHCCSQPMSYIRYLHDFGLGTSLRFVLALHIEQIGDTFSIEGYTIPY